MSMVRNSRLFRHAGDGLEAVADDRIAEGIVTGRASRRATQRIPPMTKMKRCGAKLKASVQCSIARLRARDPRILQTLLLPSEVSHPAYSERRTMRPPHCRFLLRSSYNEK